MATATAKAKAVVVSREDLAGALATVKPALPQTRVVMIGDGRVEARKPELRIFVPLDLGDLTPVAVSHERLSAVAKIAVGDVKLKVSGTQLEVTAGRGRWSLPTEQGAVAAAENGTPFLRMPAEQLKRAIWHCLPAVDAESSRYALGGVRIESAGGNLAFVATDGRRCHIVEAEIDQAVDDRSVIVPLAAAAAICRAAAAAGDDAVQLEVGGSRLVATAGSVTIHATLLSGAYPRWRDVLPQSPGESVVVSVGELLAAVRQASIVTSEQSKGIVFRFDEGSITLQGQSADAGTSEVTLAATVPQAATVKLDPRYVDDWLACVDPGVSVEIQVTDARSAVVFRHDDATGVVMPMSEEG